MNDEWRRAAGEAASLLHDDAASSDAASSDRFASCVWSCLVEPGDRHAGLAVSTLGAATALRLLLRAEPVAALGAALREAGEPVAAELAPAVDRWRPRLQPERIVQLLRAARTIGARLLVPGDTGWPAQLSDLGPAAPLALWLRGDAAALVRPAAAVVGSRAATGAGEQTTGELTAALVARSVGIVSGGAFGIDAAAHRTAVLEGGVTVAVLAGGIDRLYPAAHSGLLRRIAAGPGAIVSELPCGQAPTRWRFLLRNRLIAALATGTIVVEAGLRSGALNTAGHAAQLGRPLGAVPGPVSSAASAGCHRLIRDYGATLITDGSEAYELLGGLEAASAPTLPGLELPAVAPARGISPELAACSPQAQRLWEVLSPRRSRDAAELADRAGLAPQLLRGALAELQLRGLAGERPDGWRRA